MKVIRARFKAVLIAVLLLAIILCSAVIYTMETGKTPLAQAGTVPRSSAPAEVVATPASAVTYIPVETPISTFTLNVDDITDFVYTGNCTVRELMDLVGIRLGGNDIIEPSLDTKLANGAVVTIRRVSYAEETETVEVPYETEYVADNSMYEGEEEIEQYGVTGTTINTYLVKRSGGKVESKNLIKTVKESDPEAQIVRYGTMTNEVEETATVYQAETTKVEEEYVEETPVAQPVEEETTEVEETETVTTVTFDGSYQEYAYSLFPLYGWTDDDFNALVNLWNRESGWNPYSTNRYSGAYGIPQALPGSKMASHGDDWETNGYVQVAWGLDYIAGRYGSPSAAWSFFQNNRWY